MRWLNHRSRVPLSCLGLAVVIASFWPSPAYGQDNDDPGLVVDDARLARVDAYLDSAYQESGLPGPLPLPLSVTDRSCIRTPLGIWKMVEIRFVPTRRL